MRGRVEATQDEEIARLRTQRFDRETQWEGYAAQSDNQFVGLLNSAAAANRCTHAARAED